MKIVNINTKFVKIIKKLNNNKWKYRKENEKKVIRKKKVIKAKNLIIKVKSLYKGEKKK